MNQLSTSRLHLTPFPASDLDLFHSINTDAHVKEFCLRVNRFMESGKTRCDTAVSRRRTSIWKGLRMEARQFPISCQQRLIAGSTHVAEMFEVET